MHDLFFKDGSTLAAWVTAGATVLLIGAIIQTFFAQRSARKERIRDEQFRRLQWLDSRFNSDAMIAARVDFASEVLKDDLMTRLSIIPPIGRYVVHFFDQVARLCEDGKLDFEDVDLAYRDYVVMIWSIYEKRLSSDPSQRFMALERLHDRMLTAPGSHVIPDDLTAAVSSVRKNFWKREASLLGSFPAGKAIEHA